MMGGHLGGGAALVPAAPRLRLNLVALAVSALHLLTRRLLVHIHIHTTQALLVLMRTCLIPGPLLLTSCFVVL
jgi:hypothetical protein